jgi:predicted acylesterase/phospholipase RssA
MMTSAACLANAESLKSVPTCTAIVMSGGGSNGAWQAGVIWGFLHYGNPSDYRYDVISGTSAGALNTGALAAWNIGDELAASEFLSDTLNSLTTDQIWKKWPGGYTAGIFKAGLVDDSPALEWMERVSGQFDGYKRRITMTAVNANTGEEVVFTEKNTPYAEVPKAALSSSSVPMFFPPTHY